MDQDWILQRRETRRVFGSATWVPLRASQEVITGDPDVRSVGHVAEYFGCGCVAFPPAHREFANRLGWMDIGVHDAQPCAYRDGRYSAVDEFQYHDGETVGVELVFDHPQPVVGGSRWILNPDLVLALRLIKEGTEWVRPEEDFVVVAREVIDDAGSPRLLEIKRQFLMDYLAARDLSLRLAYYRQRVENVASLEGSPYEGLESRTEERDGGRFELLVRALDEIYGGAWASFRAWRTDVDEEEDAPVMGPPSDENTDYEKSEGIRSGLAGLRIEGEFWKEEWIEHQGVSTRVRGDADQALPTFIVETDGTRIPSHALKDEDIGRWLWFSPGIVNELLRRRGFSLEWYTAETAGIRSTSGYATHFGLNSADLVTVYAYDIARLSAWEQQVWAAHNVAPEGKVSSELLDAQVKTAPAETHAVEELLFISMRMLEQAFRRDYEIEIFTRDVDPSVAMQQVSRFTSTDQASLLRLAKELVRVFTDRLNVKQLRALAVHPDKDRLGSNKLLQDVLAQKVGVDQARSTLGPIVGAYDLRVGDAHPTSGAIGDALKLAGIDGGRSFLRQGQQLIHNFGFAVWSIEKMLFDGGSAY